MALLFHSQFHDKIDQILESLERVVERLRQPPSISAEVEKIKEQVSENKNVAVDMEKLQPLYETLRQRGEEMIARSQGTDKDISAKGNPFRMREPLNFTQNNCECSLTVQLHINTPDFRKGIADVTCLGWRGCAHQSLVNVFLCL